MSAETKPSKTYDGVGDANTLIPKKRRGGGGVVSCEVCYERDVQSGNIEFNGEKFSICMVCLMQDALPRVTLKALENRWRSVAALEEEGL